VLAIGLLFAMSQISSSFASGEWSIEWVDIEGGDVRYENSLTLDSFGYPHVNYSDMYNDDLKYVRWNGSEWQIETVDSEGNVGRSASIVLDSFNRPNISYLDWRHE